MPAHGVPSSSLAGAQVAPPAVDDLADVDLLDQLVRRLRPAWQADALCHEHPDVTWFPGRGQSTAPAKAICGRCLVRSECLAYALEHDLQGVWGGTSDAERRQLASTAA